MSRSIVALCAALAAASFASGQDVREEPEAAVPTKSAPDTPMTTTVPLLADVPVLGDLFPNRRADAFRVMLDAEGEDEAQAGGELPYRHRWLMRRIRERFPGLEHVTVLDRTTTHHAEEGTTTKRQRALDVAGPPDVLSRARAWVQRAAAP